MEIMKIKLRDKWGCPVVSIKSKPITNVIRAIIHTNLQQTFSHR